jgi:hypothetical protein
MDSVSIFAGNTLEKQQVYAPRVIDEIEKYLGFPQSAFHRADLHNALRETMEKGRQLM